MQPTRPPRSLLTTQRSSSSAPGFCSSWGCASAGVAGAAATSERALLAARSHMAEAAWPSLHTDTKCWRARSPGGRLRPSSAPSSSGSSLRSQAECAGCGGAQLP
jgi:hypothetical protein